MHNYCLYGFQIIPLSGADIPVRCLYYLNLEIDNVRQHSWGCQSPTYGWRHYPEDFSYCGYAVYSLGCTGTIRIIVL